MQNLHRIPVIGGPYACMYVVFGEIVAWMTGWMIICEFSWRFHPLLQVGQAMSMAFG